MTQILLRQSGDCPAYFSDASLNMNDVIQVGVGQVDTIHIGAKKRRQKAFWQAILKLREPTYEPQFASKTGTAALA
ncbi:hypothetical protein FS594_28035 (plasmid) [Rahnella aquatilis]|uniref:Uncharacterized protein n=1 Tax=Rahnella perminowiae TaxID=2816244 RepID=A0ABS6KYA8_9GAMM|nr:hypothetical protein [Rahnella perminowiae]MBU9834594.1 hypothetical protein [Rahnella perminowiae]UJD92566.1 hypothetical protein FS594_28035 [Rahnella aquatilis]